MEMGPSNALFSDEPLPTQSLQPPPSLLRSPRRPFDLGPSTSTWRITLEVNFRTFPGFRQRLRSPHAATMHHPPRRRRNPACGTIAGALPLRHIRVHRDLPERVRPRAGREHHRRRGAAQDGPRRRARWCLGRGTRIRTRHRSKARDVPGQLPPSASPVKRSSRRRCTTASSSRRTRRTPSCASTPRRAPCVASSCVTSSCATSAACGSTRDDERAARYRLQIPPRPLRLPSASTRSAAIRTLSFKYTPALLPFPSRRHPRRHPHSSTLRPSSASCVSIPSPGSVPSRDVLREAVVHLARHTPARLPPRHHRCAFTPAPPPPSLHLARTARVRASAFHSQSLCASSLAHRIGPPASTSSQAPWYIHCETQPRCADGAMVHRSWERY